MKKKKIILGMLAGIVAAGVAAAVWWPENASTDRGQTAAAQVAWLTDFDAARVRAQAENKPLLVDFTGSDWCPPCIMLEKQVFSRPEFAEFAQRRVVPVKIDFPKRTPLPPAQQAANDALAQRYGVRGFPTVLLLKPDGAVQGQLGYVFGGPGRFISKVEEILARP